MPERVARQRQHPAELAAADDRRRVSRALPARVRVVRARSRVCVARNARSRSRYAVVGSATIAAASSAAFTAPARPIASVPTGTPAGICTIDSSESIPFSACDSTGTPSTGRCVLRGGHARAGAPRRRRRR